MPHAVPRKERAVAFIVARLSSSRLPAKQLRRIGDRTLLDWVCDRLNGCQEFDDVVVTTVAEAENEPLRRFASDHGIPCYWYEGDVNHVTHRLRCAAEFYQADICLLISADCPLIHAPAIDRTVRALRQHSSFDVVRWSALQNKGVPALQGVVAGRLKAWQLADDLADRPELKEHQFPIIGLRPELFTSLDVVLPEEICLPFHHRLSVDTLADLEFMNTIFESLAKRHLPFDLPCVVQLLKEQPALKQINAHVHQRQLKEEIRTVLFVIDAGENYGFGHLMRCLELARQITERKGWPTHFLVDDIHAIELIRKSGHKIHWGAFSRPCRLGENQEETILSEISVCYDILVFDIFDQRGPDKGWRSALGLNMPCVVMENRLPWAFEADLIVVPNLLQGRNPIFSKESSPVEKENCQKAGIRIVGGEKYLILRNDIRKAAQHKIGKELDVLVYLHDTTRRRQIETVLHELKVTARVIDRFESEFAQLLAASRFLISGFGIGFNEALAVGTLPICWPDSAAHRTDAENFYANLGLPRLVIESAQEIDTMFNQHVSPPCLTDGTPTIVTEIERLLAQ